MQEFTLYNQSLTTDLIDPIVETTSAAAYWKDRQSRYLGANQPMLLLANMNSNEEIVGTTDFDFWCQNEATVMVEHDQEIAAEDYQKGYIELSRSILEPQCSKKYFSYKVPMHARSGKIIGVFGLSYLVDGIDSLVNAFNELGSFINSNVLEKVTQSESLQTTPLSARQIDCLYYLVKGMTSKQIANTLNLSPRTIEYYLDTIKIKLNCTNKAELIACALQMSVIKNRL